MIVLRTVTVWSKNYDDMLSRFHLIPERHWQTDRHTYFLYQYRATECWRAIKTTLTAGDIMQKLRQCLRRRPITARVATCGRGHWRAPAAETAWREAAKLTLICTGRCVSSACWCFICLVGTSCRGRSTEFCLISQRWADEDVAEWWRDHGYEQIRHSDSRLTKTAWRCCCTLRTSSFTLPLGLVTSYACVSWRVDRVLMTTCLPRYDTRIYSVSRKLQ